MLFRITAFAVLILGIETSCDETGVAIIDDNRHVRAHMVLSQIKDHEIFGGVVPEIAARAHLDHLDKLILACLKKSRLAPQDLDGIAAVCGPGLIGGVMVGMMAGKAMAASLNKRFFAVNHLEAHLLSPRLTDDIAFPYLVLLVSGGHSQILLVKDIGDYELWATTRDDAAGECFDKAAKLMGLPYPGGPHLEKISAKCADHEKALQDFPFAIPMEHAGTMDFSFSGLKTAVRNEIDRMAVNNILQEKELAGLGFAFQHIIARTLSQRSGMAMKKFRALYNTETPTFVVCGGVAANATVRTQLHDICSINNFRFMAPPPEYCTDNGAMVAWAGIEMMKAERFGALSQKARPRWPLEELGLKESNVA